MSKDKIYNYLLKYKLIILISFLVIILGILLCISLNKGNKAIENNTKKEVLLESKVIEKEEVASLPKQYFYVDIKGAVVNPNVYKLEEGSRVYDVIRLAGGLNKDADTSVLNLSKKITDEMFIIIYTKNEINKFKSNNNSTIKQIIQYIEKDCKCPDAGNNEACTDNISDNNDENNSNQPSLISINTANSTQLQTLPDIGPTKANAIINYRNINGIFKNIEDIKKVSGIGDSTFAKIKDYITL